MTTRADHVANAARRRHAVAAARRRLLAFALHTRREPRAPEGDVEDEFLDDQITLERPLPRFARGTHAPAFGRAGSSLAMRVDELRARTAAFHAQAIALGDKLTHHEAERAGLHEIREHLAAQSARLEHAVDDIDAFSQLDEQLATLDR